MAEPAHARRRDDGTRSPGRHPLRPPAPDASWAADPHAGQALGEADGGTRVQLLADVNANAGNLAARDLVDATRSVQREGPGTGTATAATDAAPAPYTLRNARFTPHKRLQEIADGGKALANTDKKPVVKAAQTALLDVGYSLLRYKDDGDFGAETRLAIEQFRTDKGITTGAGLDAATMRALDAAAPPPGKQTQHYLDYARLFADGRLDVTLAIGYDEGQAHTREVAEARTWLTQQKFVKQAAAPGTPKVDAKTAGAIGGEATKDAEAEATAAAAKGISVPETWTATRKVTYPDKDGTRITKDIRVAITLVPPGTGAKKAFATGLSESELTLYSGHARRGTGPDFDADKSPYENFVIGVNSALHKAGRVQAAGAAAQSHYVLGKKNDLEEMRGTFDPEKYRIWFFAACSSIAYMDELRGGLLPEKMDRHNLDLFGTTQAIPIAGGLSPIWANLEGILAAETMEQIVERMQRSTFEAFKAYVDKADASDAAKKKALKEYSGQMFMREGAGDNQVAP